MVASFVGVEYPNRNEMESYTFAQYRRILSRISIDFLVYKNIIKKCRVVLENGMNGWNLVTIGNWHKNVRNKDSSDTS